MNEKIIIFPFLIFALAGCSVTKPIVIGGVLGLPGIEYLKEKEAGIIDKVCAKAVVLPSGKKVCVSWHDRRAQLGVMMGANTVFSIFLIFVNPAIGGAYMGAGAMWGLWNRDKLGLNKIEQKSKWTPEEYLKNCADCSERYYYQP